MGAGRRLPFLFVLHHVLRATPVRAQFFWGFNTSSSNSGQVDECAQLPIAIFDVSTSQPINAVPPYYMFAYETGGRTTSQLLGTDSSKLTWQVAHPAGSTLLLQVADSTGRSGGVAGLFTVVQPASPANCNEVPTSSSITVAASANNVDKCSSVTLTITGGKPPYNVSIAGENEAIVTNITMPSGANVLEWINTVGPPNGFIVGVADSTGTWGQNTGLIASTGQNATCTNEKDIFSTSSASSTATTTSSSSTNTSSTAPSGSGSSDKGAIVGGVVAGLLFLGLAFSLAFFFYRRRRAGHGTRVLPTVEKHNRNGSAGANAALTNYAAVPDGYGHITPFTPGPPSHSPGPGTRYTDSDGQYDGTATGAGYETSNPFGTRSSVASFDPYADPYGGIDTDGALIGATAAAGAATLAAPHSTYPPSSRGPASTVGGWADVSNHGRSDSMAGSSSSGGRRRGSTGPLVAVNANEGAAMTEKRQLAERRLREDRDALRRQQGGASGSGPVYQHSDADDVEELPPAYRDR